MVELANGVINILAIVNGKIIMRDRIIHDSVLVFEKKIIDIIKKENFISYKEAYEKEYKEQLKLIDANGKYVSPGFIDIHIHGSGGFDTMDATIEAFAAISSTIAESGVTSYLPTTMAMDRDSICNALNVLREAMTSAIKGAKILGVNLEGPFINNGYKGAQKLENIIKPDYSIIKEYLDIIKIITLAPEKDVDHSFIKKIKENSKIILSIGHSGANYEEAMTAIERGITHATHTFNAMTPLNHRKPGVVGAIFNSDITCELIADTIHVHPAMFSILLNIKGKDKVVLITDSMRAAGMKNGLYDLGGQEVKVENGVAKLKNGTLAGSVLTLNKAVKNMVSNCDLEIYEAVAMASFVPAKVINMDNKKGSLDIGKDSDIIIFDKKMQIYVTIVEGKVVFRLKNNLGGSEI